MYQLPFHSATLTIIDCIKIVFWVVKLMQICCCFLGSLFTRLLRKFEQTIQASILFFDFVSLVFIYKGFLTLMKSLFYKVMVLSANLPWWDSSIELNQLHNLI